MFMDIYALLHKLSYTSNEIAKINIKHMQKQRLSAQVVVIVRTVREK